MLVSAYSSMHKSCLTHAGSPCRTWLCWARCVCCLCMKSLSAQQCYMASNSTRCSAMAAMLLSIFLARTSPTAPGPAKSSAPRANTRSTGREAGPVLHSPSLLQGKLSSKFVHGFLCILHLEGSRPSGIYSPVQILV